VCKLTYCSGMYLSLRGCRDCSSWCFKVFISN